jgi:2-octaprenylphenol hydroxylase
MDPRVYALSRASQALFERLDLWAPLLARRAQPYGRMRVFAGDSPDGPGGLDFDAAEIGEPDLGHIVEDNLIRELLLERLAADGRAEILSGVGIAELRRRRRGIDLVTSAGNATTADLLIAADGADSRIRTALGIGTLHWSYGQHAVVTHVACERPHRATAWQRFLPGGPLALLPLPDGRCSVVWSLPTPDSARLLGLSENEFLRELNGASAGVLGELGPATARQRFPLRLVHALRYAAPSVALVGDAAHAVHPLAGQGMNLGLRDAAVLADVLEAALADGEYPGDLRVLERYGREQKGHNLAMQLAFDGLDRLFRLPDWATPLRLAGLKTVASAGFAKRQLMRRALGLGSGAGAGRHGRRAAR